MASTKPLAPDASMMAGPEQIARFIAAGGGLPIAEAFAPDDVAIIENFAPYLFAGPDAVSLWARAMRAHLDGTSGLAHIFGPAHDFNRTGPLAFFTLPTQWKGVARGRAFREAGGWAFVLVAQDRRWRVRNYAWAVTELSLV